MSDHCRTNHTRTLRELISLYIATFLFIFPILCVNLRHSSFFRGWKDEVDAIQKLTEANDDRLATARRYLQDASQPNPQGARSYRSDHRTAQVAISVITHARTRFFPPGTNPGYLTQTVAKFLQILSKHETSGNMKFDIFVCNVDPDPDFHKEALQVSRHIKVVNRFHERSLPMVHPKEKEKQDYQFCLNVSLSYNTDFVFVVEDDAFPMDDALSVLENVLLFHKINSSLQEPSKCTTSYIKFYHPERLLGFVSISPERIPELLSFCVVCSTVGTYLYTRYHRRRSRSTEQTKSFVAFIYAAFFIYFGLVALSVGRTNLLSLRRCLSPHLYALSPAPSCCTQALLYPRASALALLAHLDRAVCGNAYAKDHVIEEFSRKERLSAYLVQPSTFVHIGLYSALRNQIVDPFLL